MNITYGFICSVGKTVCAGRQFGVKHCQFLLLVADGVSGTDLVHTDPAGEDLAKHSPPPTPQAGKYLVINQTVVVVLLVIVSFCLKKIIDWNSFEKFFFQKIYINRSVARSGIFALIHLSFLWLNGHYIAHLLM